MARRHEINFGFHKLPGLSGTLNGVVFDIWSGSYPGASTNRLNMLYEQIENYGTKNLAWNSNVRDKFNNAVRSDPVTGRKDFDAAYQADTAAGAVTDFHNSRSAVVLAKLLVPAYKAAGWALSDAQAIKYANDAMYYVFSAYNNDIINPINLPLQTTPGGASTPQTPQGTTSLGKLAVLTGHTNINIRDSGSLSGNAFSLLFEGDVVDQLSQPNSAGFVNIRTSGGVEGWVSYKYLDTPAAAANPSPAKAAAAAASSEGTPAYVKPLPTQTTAPQTVYPTGTATAPVGSGYPVGTLIVPGKGYINPQTGMPATPQAPLATPKTDNTMYYVVGGLAAAALLGMLVWKASSHKSQYGHSGAPVEA